MKAENLQFHGNNKFCGCKQSWFLWREGDFFSGVLLTQTVCALDSSWCLVEPKMRASTLCLTPSSCVMLKRKCLCFSSPKTTQINPQMEPFFLSLYPLPLQVLMHQYSLWNSSPCRRLNVRQPKQLASVKENCLVIDFPSSLPSKRIINFISLRHYASDSPPESSSVIPRARPSRRQ